MVHPCGDAAVESLSADMASGAVSEGANRSCDEEVGGDISFAPFRGLGRRLGETTGFQAPCALVRSVDMDLMDYLEWFGVRKSDNDIGELKWEWLQTSGVITHAHYDRIVEFHAIAESEGADAPKFSCLDFDARSADYDMGGVTGLEFCVVAAVVKQKSFPVRLREIVIAVESRALERVNLTCRGGTHRSVAMAFTLMLTTYPRAQFFPHTERVEAAARRRLESVFYL